MHRDGGSQGHFFPTWNCKSRMIYVISMHAYYISYVNYLTCMCILNTTIIMYSLSIYIEITIYWGRYECCSWLDTWISPWPHVNGKALHGKKSIKGAQRAIHEFMPGPGDLGARIQFREWNTVGNGSKDLPTTMRGCWPSVRAELRGHAGWNRSGQKVLGWNDFQQTKSQDVPEIQIARWLPSFHVQTTSNHCYPSFTF